MQVKLTWKKILELIRSLKLKAIIFDMDGVIIDTIRLWNVVDRWVIKTFASKDTRVPDLVTIQKDRDAFMDVHKGSNAYTEYVEFLIEKYHEVADKFQDGFFVDSHIIPWIFTVYPEKALMAPDLFSKVNVPYYHICVLMSRPSANNN